MRDFTTNQELTITAGSGDVILIDGKQLPPILAQAGAEAWRHIVEYFTANIRNPNTRAAYTTLKRADQPSIGAMSVAWMDLSKTR